MPKHASQCTHRRTNFSVQCVSEKVHAALKSKRASHYSHWRRSFFVQKPVRLTFTQSSNLSNHLKIRTKERNFSCKGSFISSLKRHLALHSRERHFSCDVCKKKFSHRCNLIVHLRVHTGGIPFSCQMCEKMFNKHSILKTHLSIHMEKGPFSC
jgi:KRAB domain-containing zinc finger protein